jgi:D-methionine transport system ATP-binding protein
MITLKNVSKTFHGENGSVEAVKNVSLSIRDGDIFGVIGFSGAGKSTLVRCINMLEKPETGEVIVNNLDLTKLSEQQLREERKKIGMIFQQFNLFRSRTVRENVAYPIKYSGMPREAVYKRVKELLDLVGIADKEYMYPSQLSGGQKQRVGIARSLASNPSVLLCDEATSALDPQTTLSILALLKELNKKLNLTIVIITHEMNVIKSICNRAAVMEDGKVVENGTIFDLFSNPREQITRDFVATTSSLHKINDLLNENSPTVQLKPNQILAHFSYNGENTVEALISMASVKFKVSINIIFADLDIIQGKPIGGLINIIEGDESAVAETFKWFETAGVRVEVIKHG